jgi:Undecaprenyl-phosphate glucose phosphotransferase
MRHPYPAAAEMSATAAVRRPAAAGADTHRIPPAVFVGMVRAGDLAVLLAGSLSAWVWVPHGVADRLDGGDLLAALLAGWIAAAWLRHSGAYSLSRLLSPAAQARGLAIALLAGAIALVPCAIIVHRGDLPAPSWIAAWLAANGVLAGTMRAAVVPLATRLHGQGRLARRVALVGATDVGRAFLRDIGRRDIGRRDIGLRDIGRRERSEIDVVGVYHTGPAPASFAPADLPFLGNLDRLIADGEQGMLDAVAIALPAGESALVTELGERLGHLVLDIYVAPDPAASPWREIGWFGGVPVGLLARRPLTDWQMVQKALFDRVLAGAMLLAFAPLLLLLAVLVRLDSPGPVLFRQRRIGLGNRPFECLKFRTMYHDMRDALADRQTTRGDPRVTRVGRWLRRLSLDEFPQLLNVLKGEMSLVGPRPHAPNTKAASKLFHEVVAGYARRHRVKPGITGWAQVNGWRGETATEEAIEQRVRHDLQYIQHWSLGWDVRILLLTAWRICADPKAF